VVIIVSIAALSKTAPALSREGVVAKAFENKRELASQMLEAWEFAVRRPELLAGWTLDHLRIPFVAVGIAIILGVSVGV